MLIDTHAHVNFSAFQDEYKEVLGRALNMDMMVINVGTQLNTSREAVRVAEEMGPGVFAAIGIHPVHTYQQMLDEEETHFKTHAEKFDHDVYFELGQNPKVVGIGECGLDYYRLPDMVHEVGSMNHEAIKQVQKETFIAQIRLAKELNKALVIHCRPSVGSQDAYEDILTILDQEMSWEKSPPVVGGVAKNEDSIFSRGGKPRFEIHSFTGTPDIVQEFLKRGAYVGMNGIITFDKTGNMEQVVKTVPLERIVLETDCPYLTPVPHRGKKNEPAYVEYVAQKVAELKNSSAPEVGSITTANARKLFALP